MICTWRNKLLGRIYYLLYNELVYKIRTKVKLVYRIEQLSYNILFLKTCLRVCELLVCNDAVKHYVTYHTISYTIHIYYITASTY